MKTRILILLALVALPLAYVLAAGKESAQSLSDGLHLGKGTTDRVGFHDATPSAQTAATATTRAALQAKGLLAADGTITATATAGAATLSKTVGTITTEALTTASGAAYTLTLTNTLVTTSSVIVGSVDNGTNTTAGLQFGRVTPAAGSVTILVWNRHASAALNGTLKISFAILK